MIASLPRHLSRWCVAAPIFAVGIVRADSLEEQYRKEIVPIMVEYCYDCHGDGSKEGDLELDGYGTIGEMISDRAEWKRIRDHVDFRLMPPPDEYAPSDENRAKIVRWIDDAVFHVDPDNPDPGHVTLRRLNRAEYENTIRDLLGVEAELTDLLPVDDSGYGFDNIGDVLTLSPLHMERYLEAAEVALNMAVDLSPPQFPKKVIEGSRFKGAGDRSGTALMLATNGEAIAPATPLGPGRYLVTVRAGADEAGGEAAKMEIKIDGKSAMVWEVTDGNGSDYRTELELGERKGAKFTVGFLNDYYDESQPEGKRDRNLLVEQVTIEGPLDGAPLKRSASHLAIFSERLAGQSDEGYMVSVMKRFIAKAFRRPVKEGEAERYLVFLRHAKSQGESPEYAIRQALAAVLVSPSFLFREEPGIGETAGGKELVSEYALASRLSYFLWSSMPDGHLRGLADRGELRKNLASEIRRMMTDPKSENFVRNFAGQWLQLRDMEAVTPDGKVYGVFTPDLARDMRGETERLFRHVMSENLPVITLLSADYTFINGHLAKHYGIQGVEGDNFRKVSLKGTPRRGLLGQGSFLTLTSHPTRTSPVLRGKYVLENLFDTPPPPPPPNIPALDDGRKKGRDSLSLRQELEAHRKDPDCASCHALMDPIGFGLDNFDGVGRWRENDRDKPLDVTGRLVTGQEFSSSGEMLDIFLKDYRDKFHRAVAVKMLTYALGRGVEYYDRTAIDGIVLKASGDDGRFLAWITAVAESVPFQYRRK